MVQNIPFGGSPHSLRVSRRSPRPVQAEPTAWPAGRWSSCKAAAGVPPGSFPFHFLFALALLGALKETCPCPSSSEMTNPVSQLLTWNLGKLEKPGSQGLTSLLPKV